MSDAASRIKEWLAAHNGNLQRFTQLIPISTLEQETNLDREIVRRTIATAEPPIYHVWPHNHAGKTRSTKPYCLRLAGADTVSLDWEDSVVAAAEADSQRRGYVTCRELGTDEHIQCLIRDPNLEQMTAGMNLRDLWAQRHDDDCIDVWIVEAKGKEAGAFDRYCFAEALSQLFEIPAEPLSALLGSHRKAGHGLCFKFANQLLRGWLERGWKARITLAVLIPLWTPDVIWNGTTAKLRSQSYFQRPYEEFIEFIDEGTSHASSVKKGEAAFAQILEGLEARYQLRSLSRSNSGLCFRLLSTYTDFATGKFILRQHPKN